MKFSELKNRVDMIASQLAGGDPDVIVIVNSVESEFDIQRVCDVDSVTVELTKGWADGSPDAFLVLVAATPQ